MTVNVVALIGVIGTICGVLFGILGHSAVVKKECKDEGVADGALKADTEYIKRRIDDVLLEQKDTNKTLNQHADRLARVEESTKSAHQRIDELVKG